MNTFVEVCHDICPHPVNLLLKKADKTLDIKMEEGVLPGLKESWKGALWAGIQVILSITKGSVKTFNIGIFLSPLFNDFH